MQTPSRLFFVIEFVRGGDLMFHMQRQRRLPEEHARFYSAEICLALNFLHDKGTCTSGPGAGLQSERQSPSKRLVLGFENVHTYLTSLTDGLRTRVEKKLQYLE